MPVITFEDVSFWYDPTQKIVADFNWSIDLNQSWSILGPSGCGKTTLLHLMAGIRQPCAGRVTFNGQTISQPHHEIGLMLQDYGLLPWYTAERNIELGLEIRHLPKAERLTRTAAWLERLDISPIRQHYPLQLSGGQRQRVALARLLALQTSVLLLDEPLSAVDELTRERLQKQLYHLYRQTTSIMVTHSIEEAVLLSDHIMVITDYAPITTVSQLSIPFETMPARHEPRFIEFCHQIRQIIGL